LLKFRDYCDCRKRKSLLQYDNVNDDGDEVDLGFDNPTYGDEMQDL